LGWGVRFGGGDQKEEATNIAEPMTRGATMQMVARAETAAWILLVKERVI